jgi:hypothetical protein
MRIKVEDNSGNSKIITGEKALAVAKKIITTYIVMDFFLAGITVVAKDLKFTLLDNQ